MTIQDPDWTPPRGLAAKQALAQAVAESREALEAVDALFDVAHGAQRAAKAACDGVGECKHEIGALTREVANLTRRTVPPMRPPEVTGSFPVRDVIMQAVHAYREGERAPDKDPDAEVEKVIERVENIRMGRRFRSAVGKAVYALIGAGALELGHVVWELIKAGIR